MVWNRIISTGKLFGAMYTFGRYSGYRFERVSIRMGWGGSICLGESQSRLYPHMCAKCWRGPKAVSKKVYFKCISRYDEQLKMWTNNTRNT